MQAQLKFSSEGVAVLVLKRLSDAHRDEDKIRGIIRGFGLSQDGARKNMGSPSSKNIRPITNSILYSAHYLLCL